jgi:sugar-phosphatase
MSARDATTTLEGRYSAFLFDMDGTVINSIAAAERIWGQWAQRHGLDVAAFLPTIHGARSVDTIARLGLPGLDPEAEARGITQAEIVDADGIIEISGAIAFLNALPPARWAIVTSAPRELALRRLQVAGIPIPAVLVTAEDVVHGKPHPDCFLLAADKLGVSAADCLIFEDAPVGIRAAEASGATVMVVTSTHGHPMTTPHATIYSYDGLAPRTDAADLLTLRQAGV